MRSAHNQVVAGSNPAFPTFLPLKSSNLHIPPRIYDCLGDTMGKKMAREKMELIMAESGGIWLSADEIMYRTNQRLSTRASIMVGAVANYMKVLNRRGIVEIRHGRRSSEYRYRL